MEYRFYFDNIGTLICDIDTINSNKRYKGRDALQVLRKMEDIDFSQGEIAQDEAILYSPEATCVLKDFPKFYKTKILDSVPNTKSYFTKMIIIFKKRDAQKKKRRLTQLKKSITKVVTSALILGLLSQAASKIDKIISEDNLEEENPKSYSTILDNEIDLNTNDIDFITTPIVQNQENSFHEDIEQQDNDNQKVEEASDIVYLDFENQFDSEKGQYAYNEYYDIVEKYATKWGISPNIIMSMLTQESGGYEKDNLMQIQFYSWENQVIYVYNFNDNREEKIVLTNNPQKFKKSYGNDIICITEADLKNPSTNISIGCILFRESCRVMNNHIIASIQCYNLGCGNMWSVFDEMQDKTGRYPDLSDQKDSEFLNYLYIAKGGDKNYVKNVSRFNSDISASFVVKRIDNDGNIYDESVNIKPASPIKS